MKSGLQKVGFLFLFVFLVKKTKKTNDPNFFFGFLIFSKNII